MQSIRINYREEKLLALLSECLRDFALIWYKQQCEIEVEIVKKNLSEWLEVLITVFSAKSLSEFEVYVSNSSVSRFSSQYHFCLNCFAFFSFLIRLLQHNQSTICKKVVCKHCERIFESNNKLHEHVRQHHAKKIVKVASKRSFNREKDKISSIILLTTSSISFKTTKISISKSVTLSERSRNASLTFSFISFKASTSMLRDSVTSSKRSNLSLFTSKLISKRVKTASTTCSLISFATFSMLRISKSKFYLIINNFHRMFHEKSRSFDLSQHQNRRAFSQTLESY